MIQTHLALTIGPIYGTFAQAKKTRSVWASSYLFSWIIKQIVAKTKDSFDIRLPYPEKMDSEYGSGLYADRIYYVGDETNNKARLQGIVDEVIKSLAKDIDDTEETYTFLKSYFNVHIIESPFRKEDKTEVYELARVNQLLDLKELQQNYVFEIEENPLFEYLTQKLNNNSLLKLDAFGGSKERKFRSISEIATTSLSRNPQYKDQYKKVLDKDLKQKEDTDFIDELKKAQIPILPHQKYYAVIYADGDNIGDVLTKAAKNPQDLKEFSRQLFLFAQKAEKTIADYGGNGIYLGGEDILTFAPVACVDKDDPNKTKTLFDLVQLLDQDFEDTIGKFAIGQGVPEPTLTYGIMISYFKHPLKEAMSYAHKLMDDKGKKNDKNRIAICLQKHSGQRIECVIEKNKKVSYKNIKDLIVQHTSNPKGNNDFIAGMMHKLNDTLFFDLFSTAIEADINTGRDEVNTRQKAFFDNFFNEDIHKAKSEFLRVLQEFSKTVFTDYGGTQDRKNLLFTALRYIHFINSTNERE